MKIHILFAIFIRLFAVFLFLNSLSGFHILFKTIIEGGYSGQSLSIINTVIYSGLPIVFAIILWKFPIIISKIIIKEELDKEISFDSKIDFMYPMLLVLGLYLLFYSARDAIFWSFYLLFDSTDSVMFVAENRANMVTTGIEIVVSMLVILNAKKISLLLTR